MISTSYSRFGGGLRQAAASSGGRSARCGPAKNRIPAHRASRVSTLDHVDGQAPARGLLYLSFMSAPVSRIVLITLSSDTKWCRRRARPSRGIDRLHRAHRVALDAGHLHQAADRMQVSPGCVPCRFRLRFRPARRAAQHLGQRAAAIEQATRLPLASDLAPEIDGSACTECRSRRRSAGSAPLRSGRPRDKRRSNAAGGTIPAAPLSEGHTRPRRRFPR